MSTDALHTDDAFTRGRFVRTLAGVASIAGAILMIELALTRIFSVTMYYHFAFLAISIALGGTAYATSSLPQGSVGTAQLQRGAVTSGKVKNGTLKAVDFARKQILKGAPGPAGPIGPTGVVRKTRLSNCADRGFLHWNVEDARSVRARMTFVSATATQRKPAGGIRAGVAGNVRCTPRAATA